MKVYKRVSKPKIRDKGELVLKISELAEQIRDGEEELLEKYNMVVKEYADITRRQAPAEETDPIMWDALCESWGKVPSPTIQYGGIRPMNYIEMTRYARGYWR